MNKQERKYSGKARISFYVDPDIKEKMKAAAKANNQSVSELFQNVCDQLLGIIPEDIPLSFSVEAKKERIVSIRMTEKEQVYLQNLAVKEGMTVSRYLYYILKGHIGREFSFTDDQLFNLRRIKGELGKIGSNLNQAVKLLRVGEATHEQLLKSQLLETLFTKIEEEKQLITDVIASNLKSWAD